ncbi:MAG TPA: AAA family ATPase [Actinomycetales bacterium]|jgi:thymidylate kinase|nr:AAA family ATPase [Actinomycetales bacterium]
MTAGVQARPYVVELFGLPGAGKSTVARQLLTRLPYAGARPLLATAISAPDVPAPIRLSRKALLVVGNVLDDRRAARAIWQATKGDRLGRRDAMHRMVQWHVTERLMTQAARRPGTTILDEGYVQCLWSVCLSGDRERWLELYGSKRRPVPDVLVALRVSPALAAERLSERRSTHSRVQSLADEALLRQLVHGDALADDLLGWWSAYRGSPRRTVEVDADATPHDVTSAVLRALPADVTGLPSSSDCEGHDPQGSRTNRSDGSGPAAAH